MEARSRTQAAARPKSVIALIAMGCLAVAVVGCGKDAPPIGAPGSTVAGEPAFAKSLRPKLEAAVKDNAIPGGVVVVSSKELGTWTASFGAKELGGSTAATADEQYRIGSNTKTMTSTVLLQLIQEGKVRFDDPISKYKAGVPNGDNITIEQLMSMRSGLSSYTMAREWWQAIDKTPARVWTPDELTALGYQTPAKFPPGEAFDYSNTNTVLLGEVIEKVTGQKLATLFAERIFKPLGMDNTLLPPTDMATIPGPHPQGYRFGSFEQTMDNAIARTGLSPDQQAAAAAGTLKPTDVTDTNPSMAWAAGGVISTPNDLTKYVKALVGGGLLSPEMQKKRIDSLRTIDPSHPEAKYGYNIDTKGAHFIGHAGDIPGFNSFMYYDPVRDISLVGYTQLNVTPKGTQASDELIDLIIAELYPENAPKPGPPDTDPL